MVRRGGKSVRAELASLERAAAEVESVADLGGAPLAHFTRAVGATTSMVFRFDGTAPEILGGSLAAAMGDYCEGYFTHDVIQQTAFRVRHIATPLILHAWQEMDWDAHRRSLAYNDFYRRVEVEAMLCVHLDEEAHGAYGQTGVVLARAASVDAFDAGELRVARYAARAMRLALRRARRLEALEREARAGRALLGERAVIVADCSGRVISATKRAEDLAADWLLAHRWLDDPLRTAVRRLARLAHRWSDDLGAPVKLELAVRPRLVAELWLTRDDRGERLVAIELETLGDVVPSAGVRALATQFRLTPTETRVLFALGKGFSNREIAKHLSISVETARTHVAHVLAKLGVGSRVEAALMTARRNHPIG